MDSSGLRRSGRDVSLKKTLVAFSNTRKSERLVKQTPQTPAVKRKSERTEKQQGPSPLRRSERGKKQSPSTSSGSKKSYKSCSSSSDMRPGEDRKEKGVEQLLNSGEVGKSGKHNVQPGEVRVKRMDARAYRALFKKQPKKVNIAVGHREEQNIIDKFILGGIDGENDCSEKREELRTSEGDLVGVDDPVCEITKEALKKNEVKCSSLKHGSGEQAPECEVGNGVGLSLDGSCIPTSHDTLVEQISNGFGRDDKEFSEEKIQQAVLVDSMVDNERNAEHINLNSDCELTSLKRKRNSMDSDTGGMPSSSSLCNTRDLVETCNTCSKRQRTDDHSTKQEFCSCTKINQQSYDTFVDLDRVEPEVRVCMELSGNSKNDIMQKESSNDLETISNQSSCYVCNLGGKLIRCEGKECKRNFHHSCLDPPLDDVIFGVWHCFVCVKKKIECGVHSVSDGVESIWDARAVEVSDNDGLHKQRQFFVKYKDLAHVHNRWVPDSELLAEAPSLVANFNKKDQVPRWKQDWALPHRLLHKRLLLSPTSCADRELGREKLGCQYEWLVKWRGLDYEHATWELENASFLGSAEGRGLIQDYENRRRMAKVTSYFSRVNKILERKRTVPVKLSQLNAGNSSGMDNNYLDYVNKLREYWHRGQNAVVIDDQEQMRKVAAFIITLHRDVYRPFLIISTSTALSLWENEFLRFAPSVNVVVYKGNKMKRRSIRTLEFYEEGGCVLFQVLITLSEIIVEDLDVLRNIGWETIVVDHCEGSITSSHFEQIKTLTTDMRLLLLAGQLKDCKDEYSNVLSLLDFNGESGNDDDHIISSDDNMGKLKERFSRHIAYSRTSRFAEYWVPVRISNVQLEQYCAALLSNSISLCSSSKNDPVGVLRDILISTRKCCNHPYVVDPSLQSLLTKGLQEVEYLDVGVKASGKLQILDAMLMEMKKRGLRVLILFQSVSGSGRDSIGDILDDFLRQRFGLDSYERIDGGILHSRKQAALNKFNNKEYGRFVFLLEVRACHSSVKLSSVDNVIIFDSDWTPVNDLKALQRITMDSRYEQVKIFRLYSSCTVEEKVLILATQNKLFDSNLQNISPSTSHMLLMWGASYLFDNLQKFHEKDLQASSAATSADQSLLEDVMKDLMSVLPENDGSSCTHDSRFMLKVQQSEGIYCKNYPLFGELKIPSTVESLPHMFWTKLLEGKHPPWKYSSVSTQRNRKRFQNIDEFPKKLELESDVVRKRKKVPNGDGVQTSAKAGLGLNMIDGEKDGGSEVAATVSHFSSRSTARDKNSLRETSSHEANDILEIPEDGRVESGERSALHDAQKSLHVLLSPEISKLCVVLQLPENIKHMVEKFLEYVINNHHVTREPATILQAFQISLCWTAASLLKHKIDHKESLALSKQHLNFDCTKEEADYVYSMLRCLRKTFLYHTSKSKVTEHPSAFASKNSPASQLTTLNFHKVKVEVDDCSLNPMCFDKQVDFWPEFAPESKLAQKDLSKSVKEIQKRFRKKLEKLTQKQQEELDEIKKTFEEEKIQLEKKYQVESAIVHSYLHSNASIRTAKLEILKNDFEKNILQQNCQMNIRLKNLEEMYLAARTKALEREADWLEKLRTWAEVELLNKQTAIQIKHGDKIWQTTERVTVDDSPEKVAPVSNLPEAGVRISGFPDIVPNEAVMCSHIVETWNGHNYDIDELNTVVSEGASASGIMEHNRVNSPCGAQETLTYINPCSVEEVLGGVISSKTNEGGLQEVAETHSSIGHVKNVDHIPPPTSGEQISNAGSSSMPDKEISCIQPKTAILHEGPDGVLIPSSLAFEEQSIDGGTTDIPAGEVPGGAPDVVSSSDGAENFPSETIVSMLNEEVLSTVPRTEPENLLSSDPPSVEEQIHSGGTLSNPVGGISQETNERINNEVVEVDNSIGQNDGTGLMVEDNASRLDQHDDVVNADNEIRLPYEMSQASLPSGQHMLTLTEGGSGPLNQATQDECVPSLTPVQVLLTAPSEVQNTRQGVECPQLLPVDQSNHEAPSTEILVPMVPSGCFQLSSGGADDLCSSEGLASCQRAQETVLVDNSGGLLSQDGPQPVSCIESHQPADISIGELETPLSGTGISTTFITSETGNGIMHTAQPVMSQMPLQLHHDPLQSELERICMEAKETIKTYDEKKLQLKSDCEKELEEVRRKYGIKLQECEAEFVLKKKDMDAIYNTVLMNKLLAEAFRSKCTDIRTSGASGMHRDVNSSFTQQLLRLSLQQNGQRPASPLVRPSSLQPPIAPSANLQTSHPPNPRGASPSHAVHHPSSLSPSTSARPPHIGSITSAIGNLQVGSTANIRAPAPHLQPFRPSTASPSFPRGMPSQHGSTNLSPVSPSVAQLQPQLPSSVQQSNQPLSALALLMDVNSRAVGSFPNRLPLLSDLRPNFNSAAVHVLPTKGVPANTIHHTSGATDIVCLSDDD